MRLGKKHGERLTKISLILMASLMIGTFLSLNIEEIKSNIFEIVCVLKGEPIQKASLILLDGQWQCMVDGKLDSEYCGFVDFEGSKFFVEKGTIATHVNGLVQDPENSSDSYYLVAGQVQKEYTGLILIEDQWIYLIEGRFAEDYTGKVDYNGNTFDVVNGRVEE